MATFSLAADAAICCSLTFETVAAASGKFGDCSERNVDDSRGLERSDGDENWQEVAPDEVVEARVKLVPIVGRSLAAAAVLLDEAVDASTSDFESDNPLETRWGCTPGPAGDARVKSRSIDEWLPVAAGVGTADRVVSEFEVDAVDE